VRDIAASVTVAAGPDPQGDSQPATSTVDGGSSVDGGSNASAARTPTTKIEAGFWRRHAVKFIASALITFGVIYTVQSGGLKLVPEGGDWGNVRWEFLALYVPLVFAFMWFRAVRGRFLFRAVADIPRKKLVAVTFAGYLAILLLPFRIGELARPYMLRTRAEDRREGKPHLTMTTATSAVVAERVIDGVFFSGLLAIVLLLVPTIEPLPERVVGLPISVSQVRAVGFITLGVFSAALVVIMVFYFGRSWAERLTHAVLGRISPKLAEKVAGTANKLADGLHIFKRGRDAIAFLAETAAYWGCNALGLWVLAIGCGITHADGSSITFLEACALMGMLGCTIMIPGPPGLIGVFQAGIYAGMTMYFPTSIVVGNGAAFVFLVYATQVLLTIATGVWGVWHEGGANRMRAALVATDP
jgi:glycosyltransferase 2 family protein